MKKCVIFIEALLFVLLLAACAGNANTDLKSGNASTYDGNANADLKSESAIQADLEQSDHFWYLLAPNAPDEYNITDFVINGRVTEPEQSDTVAVTVTAKSEYALYTGTFSVKYLYHENTGYVYDSVFQGIPGSYSEIRLPSDNFAKAYFEPEMATFNGTLQTVEIEQVPSDDKICKMNAVFESRDDAAHCTSTISASAISHFNGGTWQKEGADMDMKVTEEVHVYDVVNEIYWLNDSISSGIELINAYVVDGLQYYDRFIYYSDADLNYKDVMKYGFIEKEVQVLEESCYMGCDGYNLLGEATGPIDEQTALKYLEQIKIENPDVLIITDPEQYLSEALFVPDYMIISEKYIDEDGLNVVELVRKGTPAYDEALNN